MKHIEVVAAVIERDGKVFCAQRENSGETACKWEFPGGKIEPGETHRDALIREISEELRITVEVGDFIMTVNHQYASFRLTMHAYRARLTGTDPVLTEHLDARWLSGGDLFSVDWAGADIPVVKRLSAKDCPVV